MGKITIDQYPGKDGYNYSYAQLFNYVSKKVKNNEIKHILEYGTGYSTVLLSVLFPDAEIVSIEHNQKWYDYYSDLYKDNDRIKVVFVEEDVFEQFVNKYDYKPDIVFIDGYKREYCYEYYSQTQNKPKLLFFHDAQWFFKFPEIQDIERLKNGEIAILDFTLWKNRMIDNLMFEISNACTTVLFYEDDMAMSLVIKMKP